MTPCETLCIDPAAQLLKSILPCHCPLSTGIDRAALSKCVVGNEVSTGDDQIEGKLKLAPILQRHL